MSSQPSFFVFPQNLPEPNREQDTLERERIVRSFYGPFDEFKKNVENFIESNGNINGFVNDGNILQCALAQYTLYKNQYGIQLLPIIDYLLENKYIDPLYTPQYADTIEMCLFCEGISKEIADKVISAIHKKHNEYIRNYNSFITSKYNCTIADVEQEIIKYQLRCYRYAEFCIYTIHPTLLVSNVSGNKGKFPEETSETANNKRRLETPSPTPCAEDSTPDEPGVTKKKK
jgi:hypothetical protein